MYILCNQRDATYTAFFFIIISALHVSGGFSAHHQELIKLYVEPWVLSCFPAVYRWCGWVVTRDVALALNSDALPTALHQTTRPALNKVLCATCCNHLYRVSQEDRAKLRESVPYVKLYRYNPKHLYPKLNRYGDNGQRKVWTSCIFA